MSARTRSQSQIASLLGFPSPERFAIDSMKGQLSMGGVPFALEPKRLGEGEGYAEAGREFRALSALGWLFAVLGSMIALGMLISLPWGFDEAAAFAFSVAMAFSGVVWIRRMRAAARVRRVLVHRGGELALLITTPTCVVSRHAAPSAECTLQRHKVRLVMRNRRGGADIPLGTVHAAVVWVAGEPFAIAASRARDDLARLTLPPWLQSIDRGEGPELEAGGDVRLWGP